MKSPEPIAIDPQRLLDGDWDQISELLISSYPQPSTTISAETVSDIEYAANHFMAMLFKNYFANSKLHPQLSEALEPLRTISEVVLLDNILPWKKSDLRTTISLIHNNAIGWEPSQGRAADNYLQKLDAILKHINKPLHLETAANALDAFFEKEKQKISKLEKRLIDTETGLLHARHASQLSAKTLNSFMIGKKLPADVVQFLQGPWRESLKLIIIQNSEKGQKWQQSLRLTETLIWSFQPFDKNSDDHKNAVHDAISELSEKLRENVIGLQHSSELETEMSLLEKQHLSVLKGQALEYSDFELLHNDDPLVTTQAKISDTLIKQVVDYKAGQWFIFQFDDEAKKVKLSASINHAQQLLFTNFLGIKTHQYSLEEFAYLVASKQAIPIKTLDPFQATGEKLLLALAERYRQQQQKMASDAATEKEHIRLEKIARQAAREKALKEANLHIEKQRAERLSAAKAKEKDDQRESNAQRDKAILDNITRLTVGGQLLFYNEQEHGEKCKLAAIIQASGDYIFVDKQGMKKFTLKKQQIIDQLSDDSAKIIDLGSNFESTLEQVVNTIRTRKEND